jgi:hypothetical protein
MTDDRSLERAARSWLETGPTQAPPRAVEAALLRIDTTPQDRDLPIPRRFTQMSMPARLATAAVIGALAVGGVFYLLGPGRSSNVGAPIPSPSVEPTSIPGLGLLTERFASPTFGYTIAHGPGWMIIPATPSPGSTDFLADGDQILPKGTDSSLAVRSDPLGSDTFETWLGRIRSQIADDPGVPTDCRGGDPSTWPEVKVGGETGHAFELCNASGVVVQVGNRGYVFFLTNSTNDDAEHLTKAGLDTLLGTVTFDPTGVPSASASPSASLVGVPAPALTMGDWQAMADTAIPGLIGAGEHIQLSIDWQDGVHTWIQTNDGSWVVKSTSVAAPAGEIRLVADAAGYPDCNAGDVGRYSWERSVDGLYLTLVSIEDACAQRAAAMGRTWVHSLSAVTDGGLGVMPLEGFWVRMTLPQQRFGLSGNAGYGYLHQMEGPERSFFAIKDPMGVDKPCGTERQAISIGSTSDSIVSYLGGLPGFTAKSESATLAGLPATHVTLTPKGSSACPGGLIPVLESRIVSDTDREWNLTTGIPHSLWVVDRADGAYVFIYEGAGVAVGEEDAVISSMTFLDDLPTPP